MAKILLPLGDTLASEMCFICSGLLCPLTLVAPIPVSLLGAQQLLGYTPGCSQSMQVVAGQQQTLATAGISCAISCTGCLHGLVRKTVLSNNIDEADLSSDRKWME